MLRVPREQGREMIKREGSAIHPENDSLILRPSASPSLVRGEKDGDLRMKCSVESVFVAFFAIPCILQCFSPHLVVAAPLICIISAATSNERV